nr:hypothetical protein BaRGS_024589 [Batillaria attramentaria]
MEHTQNTTVMALLVVIVCACVAAALPAPDQGQGELSHLVKLIGKLKNLENQRETGTGDSWGVYTQDGDEESQSLPNVASSSSSNGASLAALKHGFLGLNKRQGAWSYDYGLGGGRFGKRNYGDYGIGGGRFGRDVDHVDLGDTNDSV